MATLQINGSMETSHYGKALADGFIREDEKLADGSNESQQETQIVLQSFRLLIADLCEQFNMGHPGGAMGMAAIGVALFKYAMVYAPHEPQWFNRDRFLLSNGVFSGTVG